MIQFREFTLDEALEIARRNDPGDKVPSVSRVLIAEMEALRRDAERYRWLRDLPEGSPHEQIGNFPGYMWDEAIDAARGAEG